MRKLMLLIIIGSIYSCNSTTDFKKINYSHKDSMLIQCINDYYLYLDSGLRDNGDKNYAIYTKTFKSNDTISYLFNGIMTDDIYILLIDSFKYVYQINNHNVFTKNKIFSFNTYMNIDSVLKTMDNDGYDFFRQKGYYPYPPAVWDCKFLYVVINKDKIISKEIRYLQTPTKRSLLLRFPIKQKAALRLPHNKRTSETSITIAVAA